MQYVRSSRVVLLTSIILCTLLSACTFKVIPKSQAADSQNQDLDLLKDAKWLSDEAYNLVLKGEYEKAIVKAELAVKKDPNLGEAQKNLALAYCDSGRPGEALRHAEKAVASTPESSKAHFVFGKVLYKLERYKESIPHLNEAIRLNPEYGKAHYLLGEAYDLAGQLKEAKAALDRALQLEPANEDYASRRATLVAYTNQQKSAALPVIKPIEGKTPEYAMWLYSSLFYEALIHHDFDLIDRAADNARESREILPGGLWKLQIIYALLSAPSYPTSDYDWNSHLELLKRWSKEKPNSPTAQVALASGYLAFAWRVRGDGFANEVKKENWPTFYDLLAKAQAVLETYSESRVCPKWYSVMQKIALAQQWERSKYDRLYANALAFEPTWYEYYQQKAIHLLPRWGGEPGEVDTYIESLAVRPGATDNTIVYFLVRQYADAYVPAENQSASSYPKLKDGFLDLRKQYGVTFQDQDYVFNKAKQANDMALVQELDKETKGKVGLNGRLTKEQFDGLVSAFKEKKQN